MKGILLVSLLFSASLAAAETPGSYLVIVNAQNTLSSASRSLVSGLFMKRIEKWPNGDKSRPVDLTEVSSVREAFSRQIHVRSAFQIEQYWQSTIFSGRAIPPPKKASESEVVEFVARNPGAIGYVSPATRLPTGVKVLQVEGK